MRIGVLLFLLVSLGAMAQQEGRIETDRPDQTECPFIVKRGYFQAEIGFNRAIEGTNVQYLTPTSLLKIGVHPLMELRYTLVQASGVGLSTESFGFKSHIYRESGWFPRTALIVQYHVNQDRRDQSELNNQPHSVGETILTFQNSLGGPVGIGYNLGAEYHSDGGVEGIYRIAPNINLGKRGYAYAEIFGRFPTSVFTDTWVDGGLAYYVSDDLKIDLSAGKSIKQLDSWYAALGISFRMRLW